MLKSVLAASFTALYITCATAPAWAGCADDIKKAESDKEMQLLMVKMKNQGAAAKAEEKLDAARKALAAGKKKKCTKLVGVAESIISAGAK